MTPISLAEITKKLKKNTGSVLEPSSGTGIFLDIIPDAIGCELEQSFIQKKHSNRVIVSNFFELPIKKVSTIIGNPPYVNGRDISAETLAHRSYTSVLPATANLYFHFIEKCFHHLDDTGELIFIVPTSLFKSSYGNELRKLLLQHGGFTDIIWNVRADWENAGVETCIFRYAKGACPSITCKDGKILNVIERSGFMFMSEANPVAYIGDFFTASVGAAPRKAYLRHAKAHGAEEFYNVRGSQWYDTSEPALWPRWQKPQPGRKILFDSGPTRKYPRFKVSSEEKYTSYALFPKDKTLDLDVWCNFFETYDKWEELGFILNGRWTAGPKMLEATPIIRLP